MEIICINDVFSPEQRQKIKNLPVEGRTYTIRKVVRNADGSYGLLLNEIHNQKRPVSTVWEGMSVVMEPNFGPHRFSTIYGNYLSVEMLDSLIQPKKLETV